MHLLRRNLKLQPGLNSHPIIMMQFHIPFNRSISSTQVCMQVSKRPGLPPLFTTLDPRRLTSTNFRSIAGNISCRLRNKTTPEYKSSLIHYKRIGRIYVPFPEGTDGFFYYHSGPAYAPVAGELRFRVVPSANPDNFNTGHDLVQFHGGLPWSAPLPVLLQRPSYSALLPILKLDLPTLASIIELIDTKGMPLVDSDVKLIHSLGQPFYADLSKTRITYRVVQGSTIGKSRMFQLLADRRKAASGAVIGAPYTGGLIFLPGACLKHAQESI
jgi:hypothetical protein